MGQALLSASDVPSDVILERLCKSKLQDSVQLQTVLAFYDPETVRNNEQTSYLRMKASVKLRIDQMMRTLNFRVQNGVVERGAVTKSRKGKKACVERKVGECFLWKAHGQCSEGNSCSFSHDKLVQGDLYGGQRRKGRSSAPAPNSKAKTDEGEEKSSKTSGNREESSSDKGNNIPCPYKNCTNPSCKFWHPPVCQNHKSETGCKYGRKCFFRHVDADEKPIKKSKKDGAKGSVALLKESALLGCVSQDSYPRKSVLGERGKFGSRRAVKSSNRTCHKTNLKERVIHEELSQILNRMSVVLARQNSRKDHMRRPCTKKDAPAE